MTNDQKTKAIALDAEWFLIRSFVIHLGIRASSFVIPHDCLVYHARLLYTAAAWTALPLTNLPRFRLSGFRGTSRSSWTATAAGRFAAGLSEFAATSKALAPSNPS